jgi:hypothetical protein
MAIKHTRGASRSRDEWARLIEAWKASGLTASQFATRHGVKPKALSTWRWRLKSQSIQPSARSAAKLVQLSVADLVGPGDTDCTRWELTTVCGHRLRVQAPLAGAELAQLLGILVPGRGRR